MRYRQPPIPISVYRCATCPTTGTSGAMNGLHLIGRAGTKKAKARQVLVCSTACESQAYARGLVLPPVVEQPAAKTPDKFELTGTPDSIHDKQIKRTRRRSRV